MPMTKLELGQGSQLPRRCSRDFQICNGVSVQNADGGGRLDLRLRASLKFSTSYPHLWRRYNPCSGLRRSSNFLCGGKDFLCAFLYGQNTWQENWNVCIENNIKLYPFAVIWACYENDTSCLLYLPIVPRETMKGTGHDPNIQNLTFGDDIGMCSLPNLICNSLPNNQLEGGRADSPPCCLPGTT